MNESEKKLDLELLLFFLIVSIITFFFYIFRHPFVSMFIFNNTSSSLELFKAYLPDLIIYLSVFSPYTIIIIFLIFLKILKKAVISDYIIVVLFFPIISFFTKGMSLLDVYTEKNIIDLLLRILKDNLAFFSFLFIGPLLLFIHFIVVFIIRKKRA